MEEKVFNLRVRSGFFILFGNNLAHVETNNIADDGKNVPDLKLAKLLLDK